MKKPSKIEAFNKNLSTAKADRPLPASLSMLSRLSERESRIQKMLVVREGCDYEIGKELYHIQQESDFEDKTFEAYVKRRWERTRQWGYQLIDSFKVIEGLPQNVKNSLQNTGQVLALKAAEPEERAAIIEAVASEGKVTAKAISAKIEEKEVEKEKPSEAEFEMLDKTGHPIPKRIRTAWEHAESEAEAILKFLMPAKKLMEEKIQNDPAWIELSNNENTKIKALVSEARRIIPHAVCPSCDAHGKSCKHCKQNGYISKYLWDACSKEAKGSRK